MSHQQKSPKARSVTTFVNQGLRPSQEDYVLADREKGVFVVADGFGGQSAGFEAAKSACEAVRNFLFKEAGDLEATLPFILRPYFSLAGNVLFNSLIHANRKLNSLNKNKNINERGGASVVAGFIDGNLLAIANVGVCTAWLMRGDKVIELLTPRSLSRLSDPFSKNSSEDLQVPLIALGITQDLEPEIFEVQIHPEDWVVFSTDGILTDVIDSISAIKQKKEENSQSIREVNELLGQKKYSDNVSISVVII